MSKGHFLTFCTTHGIPLSCFNLRLYISMSKHLKFSFLITAMLVLSGGVQAAVDPVGNKGKCEPIEVKLTITHTTGNQPNGAVQLDYQDASETYTYFMFSSKAEANRLEGKGNTISNLDRGEYNLYVQNPEGCTKHLNFKIN